MTNLLCHAYLRRFSLGAFTVAHQVQLTVLFDDREFADGDETGTIAVMIVANCLRIFQIYLICLLHEVKNVTYGPAGCKEAAAVGLLARFA
jgi:hypothetical protein